MLAVRISCGFTLSSPLTQSNARIIVVGLTVTFAVNPDENSPQNFGAFQAKAKSLVNVPAPKRFKVDVGVNKKGDAELVYTPPFIDGVKKGGKSFPPLPRFALRSGKGIVVVC